MWSILGMVIAATYDDPATNAQIPSSDEELVAAFKAGDVQAFDALFTRYRQPSSATSIGVSPRQP